MKKKSSPEPLDDDLRPEYGPELFKTMKPNRFANVEIAPPIYLDEDVAEVFDSSEAEHGSAVSHQSDGEGRTKARGL